MTEEAFEYVMKNVKLPVGKLLADKKTYRLCWKDFEKLDDLSQYYLRNFEKLLILSDGHGVPVGGVLFYGSSDIQAEILPPYRGQGYMSAIHKNGVLKKELYPHQRVSIYSGALESLADLKAKCRLLQMIGLQPSNANELVKLGTDYYWRFDDGREYTEEEFRKEFGLEARDE